MSNRYILRDTSNQKHVDREVWLEVDEEGVDLIIDGVYIISLEHGANEIKRYEGAAKSLGFRAVGDDICAFEEEKEGED